MAQALRPDADVASGNWQVAPLWSKIDEASAGGDVITDTTGDSENPEEWWWRA